jgi:hypothetical protein
LTNIHFYEVRPRKDHRGVDLVSDCIAIRFPLWYEDASAGVNYAKHSSKSHDEAGNVIKTQEHAGEFKNSKLWPYQSVGFLNSFGVFLHFFDFT